MFDSDDFNAVVGDFACTDICIISGCAIECLFYIDNRKVITITITCSKQTASPAHIVLGS